MIQPKLVTYPYRRPEEAGKASYTEANKHTDPAEAYRKRGDRQPPKHNVTNDPAEAYQEPTIQPKPIV